MADWALNSCERQETNSAVLSRGAANAKGSYVQLSATTTFSYKAIEIQLVADGGGGQTYLVDLAIGAGGSEVIIVSDILFDSARGVYQNMVSVPLPISIPAGTRIAARCQEAGGAGTRNVNISVIGRSGGANFSPSPSGAAVNYGSIQASTNGVLVDPGATLNAYGAWTEIILSTTRSHSGIVAVLGTNKQVGTLVDSPYFFQIGIGSAGSEQQISEFYSAMSSALNRCMVNVFQIAASIPNGTRLAMRSKCVLSAAAGARHPTAIILGY